MPPKIVKNKKQTNEIEKIPTVFLNQKCFKSNYHSELTDGATNLKSFYYKKENR